MKRRKFIGATSVAAMWLPLGVTLFPEKVGADTPRSSEDGPDAKPLTFRERRFRWIFTRALKIQKRKGKIDAKTYRRFKVAAWSGMPIAGGPGTTERKPLIGHLADRVEKERKSATGLFDDFSFDGILQWILENWQLVARIVLMLLVFLDKAESE